MPMYSIYGERRNTRSIGLRGSTDDRTSQKKKKKHKNTKNINLAKNKNYYYCYHRSRRIYF
jgi:hypothetical protein